MENNGSREELLHKLKDIDEKIKQIHEAAEFSGTPISMSELISLEDEKEALEEKLEKEYDKEREEDKERDDELQEEPAQDEFVLNESEELLSEREDFSEEQEIEVGEEEREVPSRIERTVSVEEKETPEDKNSLEAENGKSEQSGPKKTFLDWQVESGIDVLADDAIMAKYDKDMTREDFLDIINKENVAKVIREPGRAEDYLKSSADWRAAETSDSALREAEMSGNLPTQADSDDYIRSANGGDDNKFMDNDNDGRIDQDDIKEDEMEENVENTSGEGKEKGDEAVGDNSTNLVTKEVIKNVIKDIENGEMDSVGASLLYGMTHPEKLLAQENEIDNDDTYEITPPNIMRP